MYCCLKYFIFKYSFIFIQDSYPPVTNSHVPPTCIRSIKYSFKLMSLCEFGGSSIVVVVVV